MKQVLHVFIYAELFDGSSSLQITNSIFKQGVSTAITMFAEQVFLFNLKILECQFLNNSGCNLELHCTIASTVVIEKSQFIQTLDTKVVTPDYGIAIYGCQDLEIKNSRLQLQNVRTSILISETAVTIANSDFSGNKNSQSTSTLYIENTCTVWFHTQLLFLQQFHCNGLLVITVKKNSLLTFFHCIISDNNMTGITLREGAIVTFLTMNKIQNNKASEGAGIKLLPDAQVTVVGILWIYDNIAYQGAGGGIYQVTSLQLPSDSLYTDVNCTIV